MYFFLSMVSYSVMDRLYLYVIIVVLFMTYIKNKESFSLIYDRNYMDKLNMISSLFDSGIYNRSYSYSNVNDAFGWVDPVIHEDFVGLHKEGNLTKDNMIMMLDGYL